MKGLVYVPCFAQPRVHVEEARRSAYFPSPRSVMTAFPDTTLLLRQAGDGDAGAAERLYAHVYEALRTLAQRRLRAYRPGETLDTTSLVHEAYLKLVDGARVAPTDRPHFLALAARAMRFVLVDYARARTAEKRGGAAEPLSLGAVQLAAEERAADLLALDEALDRLRLQSDRLADVVEYRFFGGLTYPEIAEATGHSVATVERDWTRARAWLYRALAEPEADVP